MDITDLFQMLDKTIGMTAGSGMALELAMLREKVFVKHLMKITSNKNAAQQVQARAAQFLDSKLSSLKGKTSSNLGGVQAHNHYLAKQISRFLENPKEFELPPVVRMPDGSPIGCGVEW